MYVGLAAAQTGAPNVGNQPPPAPSADQAAPQTACLNNHHRRTRKHVALVAGLGAGISGAASATIYGFWSARGNKQVLMWLGVIALISAATSAVSYTVGVNAAAGGATA